MISQVSQPRLKGFRSPSSIISYAIWAYHRFGLSLRDVEVLLAERGVIVSYESIRVWCQRFGTQIAAKIRRDHPVPAGKWHLDEVVSSIRGQKHWLWRAVDANGDVLGILLQSRRKAHAAKRFLSVHEQTATIFRPKRHRLSAAPYRQSRANTFSLWNNYAAEMTA